MPAQRIRRNQAKQIVFVIVAVALLGLAAWSVVTIQFAIARWGIAVAAVIAALIAYSYGTGTSGVAPCPHCGLPMTGLDPTTNHAALCSDCRRFSSGTGGMLDVTPADYVAPRPVFGCDLPAMQAIRWPTGCAVCGLPATRTLETKRSEDKAASMPTDLAVGVASLGLLKAVDRTTYRLDVPHCATCTNGVALMNPSSLVIDVALGFRSFAYYQQFVATHTVQAQPLVAGA